MSFDPYRCPTLHDYGNYPTNFSPSRFVHNEVSDQLLFYLVDFLLANYTGQQGYVTKNKSSKTRIHTVT